TIIPPAALGSAEGASREPEDERDRGRDEDEAVDAIEDSAVARKQRARVLRAGGAFDRGLHEVAREPDGSDEQGEQRGRSGLDARGRRDEEHHDGGGAEPRERAFPGLSRADARRDLAPADPGTDHVRRDVGRPGGYE